MTIDEFYAEDVGPYARALSKLSETLTQHAQRLWENSDAPWDKRLSPWMLRLGKGGLRTDRKTGKQVYFPEVSLYRHVADVGFIASFLFYWSWQTGTLPIEKDIDVEPYIAILLVIALFHDADKYVASQTSVSPSLEQVQRVWNDLGGIGWVSQSIWPEFSPAALHSAVSLVENRGQSQALLGPSLSVLVQRLAHVVGQADNFMSKTAVSDPGGVMNAWVEAYNEKIADWHELYGVPNKALTLLQFQDDPAVLQRIVEVVRASEWFYPLVVQREGRSLSLTLPQDVSPEFFLYQLENYAFQKVKEPRMIRNAASGRIVLMDCESAQDLHTLIDNHPITVVDVLSIKAVDIAMVEDYFSFWMASTGGLYESRWQNAGTRKILVPFIPAGDRAPSYDRALGMALVLGDSDGNRDARLHRALDESGPGLSHSVRESLQSMLNLDSLDGLTLRTIVSLQSALMMEDSSAFDKFLEWIYGPFPVSQNDNAGPRFIINRLRSQVGLPTTLGNGMSYQIPEDKLGTCLICGQQTATKIKTGSMELVGVKRSAFNNRIGHQKSLWSQSEPNYICAGCTYAQELMGHMAEKMGVSVRKSPLLVTLPVRAIWHTPAEVVPQPLRSFDAVAFKEKAWTKVLPWNADQGLTFPLAFEEKPDRDIADSGRNDDILSQIWRLSLYAAMSGEPVHVFVAAQRSLPTSFYYEPLPTWLATLLGDLHSSGEVLGVSREKLPQWIERLDLLRKLSTNNGSREVLMDLPQYGWWAAAWLVGRSENGDTPETQKVVTRVKEWYPMENYNELLCEVASDVVDIQRSVRRADATRSQITRVLRRVLDEYQALNGQQSVSREFMLKVISGLVYQDLSRTEERVDDQRVLATVDKCLRIVEQANQDEHLSSKMVKYLLAAFEMSVREARRESYRVSPVSREGSK